MKSAINLSLIKLYSYLFAHCTVRSIKNPKWAVKSLLYVFRIKDIALVKERVFGQYLPNNYLLKTRLHIKEPTQSIYKKVRPLLPNNYFSAPEAITTDRLGTPQKILLIRSGAMGDVLLSTPVIRKLHHDREGFCSIDISTRHPEIFKNNPYVSNTLPPDALKRLRHHYDMIINLDMSLERNRHAHITDVYSFFAFGSSDKSGNFNKQPELFPDTFEKKKIIEYISSFPNGYIVCHNRTDPSQPYRNIPVQLWKKLLLEVVEHTNVPILQIGLPFVDTVLDQHENFIDVRGKFNLQELRELIQHAKLFLGTDAGPLHIAACTSTPIISFFTLAHHESRKPLRQPSETAFIPIIPKIDCYGCLSEYPLPWSFECQQGNFACTQKFDIQEAIDACCKILTT